MSIGIDEQITQDTTTGNDEIEIVSGDGSGNTATVNSSKEILSHSSQSGTWSVEVEDGSGNRITSTSFNSQQALDVRPVTGFSTASNTRPSIAATSVQILAANTARRYAYISNQSGNIMFLKFGATAVANQGIRLANNSIYEITAQNLWTGTINAISSSSTASNLDVFEGS